MVGRSQGREPCCSALLIETGLPSATPNSNSAGLPCLPRSQFALQGWVMPAKVTRSATVKSPGAAEGSMGENPPAFR